MAKPKPTHCAYCWATGQIEFAAIGAAPKSAIEFARGPEAALREAVEVAATRDENSENSGDLLVPGVQEAPNQSAGGDALGAFVSWCREVLRVPGVTFQIKVVL